MLRFLSGGESHGQALTAIIEGMVSGLPLTAEYINSQLARRQGGYGRGGRMAIEKDQVDFLTGVRNGLTLGSPITLIVRNKDWANWEEVMSPHPGAKIHERMVTKPRPGHADLSGAIKYHHDDVRNILERSSARETAVRVAVGTVGRRLLEELGIKVFGHVVNIGGVVADVSRLSIEEIGQKATGSQVYCADEKAEAGMIRAIDEAKQAGDSLGGVFEVLVTGLPVGLGSHVHWDRKLDGRLAQGLMSIQAIKGVEVGIGFQVANLKGSQVHDEIYYSREAGFYRSTNRAGGLEGGMTNSQPLVIRAAMKPIPTLYTPLQSVDLATKEPFAASVERSDICAVPAASVVGEAVVAYELAAAVLEKFGGDNLAELQENYRAYQSYVKQV
ncbi:MAG: chorismate synthase [Clostridia bacterium]|nr:chorismate synthase [Clostridia bacterium]